MTILLGVIALFALVTLLLAVQQGRALVQAAPRGEQLGSFMVLGWWKFARLEAKAGPAAAQHVEIYKRAAIAFLIFIVLGVILSGWVVNQRPVQPAGTTADLINDPRVIPADLAFNTDLRRVAMPGAPLVES